MVPQIETQDLQAETEDRIFLLALFSLPSMLEAHTGVVVGSLPPFSCREAFGSHAIRKHVCHCCGSSLQIVCAWTLVEGKEVEESETTEGRQILRAFS